MNNYEHDAVVPTEKVTPQKLRAMYKDKKRTIDPELIAAVQQRLISAALKGHTSKLITMRVLDNWETTNKYFEDCGFSVGSYGSDSQSDYDDLGDETFTFVFEWQRR
jgi:hypothetical protein